MTLTDVDLQVEDPFNAIASLQTRILVGGSIILAFIAYDVWKNGRRSPRLREYGFVIAVIAATAMYAILHDMITVSISPEYFTYGKGLSPNNLRWRVCELAMKAALAPGAFVSMVFVVANNPSPRKAQLSYAQLWRLLVYPVLGAIVCAVVFGILGAFDVRGIRPEIEGAIPNTSAFIEVWGIHWGTYAGGFFGAIAAVFRIRSLRARANN